MDQEIPPIPARGHQVREARRESALLSEFWGRPMYLDAIVLLPEAFDEHPEARYPLVVSQGHYRRTIAHWRETPPEDEMRTADSEPEPAQTEDRPKVEPIRAALRGQPWVEPIVGYRNHPSYKPTEERYAYQLYKDWTGPGFPRVIKVDVQSHSLLRRLLRRELGQQRPLRRRGHLRAHCVHRENIPGHRRRLCAGALRRLDRWVDVACVPGVLPRRIQRYLVGLPEPCYSHDHCGVRRANVRQDRSQTSMSGRLAM